MNFSLELARSLQEEERRAAVAEQERAQRQQVGGGAPQGVGNSGQRHPQRVDSRESKKSDVSCTALDLIINYLGLYSPTILKNILCLFLEDLVNLNVMQLLIG